MVCVQLTSEGAILRSDVVVSIATSEITGISITQNCNFLHTFPLPTAISGSDFTPITSMTLTFSASSNDTEICVPVIALDDQLVECDEYYSIVLSLLSPIASSLNIASNETTITLIDADCM